MHEYSHLSGREMAQIQPLTETLDPRPQFLCAKSVLVLSVNALNN